MIKTVILEGQSPWSPCPLMIWLLHLSIYCQKRVWKCTKKNPGECQTYSCPYFVLTIVVNYPCQDSDSSSCLLVSGHTEPEVLRWQLYLIVLCDSCCVSWQGVLSLTSFTPYMFCYFLKKIFYLNICFKPQKLCWYYFKWSLFFYVYPHIYPFLVFSFCFLHLCALICSNCFCLF